MKSILYLIFGIPFLFLSCKNKDPVALDTFVGGSRVWDQRIPYPYILNKENGVYVLYNENGKPIDRSSKHDSITKGDTLNFINHQYYIPRIHENNLSIYDLKDSLKFPRDKNGNLHQKLSAKFFQLQQSKKIDLKKTIALLQNNIWEYNMVGNIPNRDLDIKHYVQFKNDRMIHLRSYYYDNKIVHQEYDSKKYYLFKLNNIIFISFPSDQNNPQELLQIINIDQKGIQWVCYLDKEPITLSLRKESMIESSFEKMLTNEFKLCYDGFQAPYYYGNDVTYNHGNDFLVKSIGKNAPTANKEGYITIHFNINCERKIGRLGVEQMDKSFQPIQFNSELIKHIIQNISQLDEWPLIASDYDWIDYKDVHAFLMFKIRNGKIVDICP